jgi:hypothetical protein
MTAEWRPGQSGQQRDHFANPSSLGSENSPPRVPWGGTTSAMRIPLPLEGVAGIQLSSIVRGGTARERKCTELWGDMRQIVRWSAAGLVTLIAFAVPAWISAAIILPAIIKDPGIRWGIAGSVGVALAGLAALWGHSFATAAVQPHEATSECDRHATTRSGNVSNEISGGILHGPVMQGRDFTGTISPAANTQQDPNSESEAERR